MQVYNYSFLSSFLGGVHWYLAGLSELLHKQRLHKLLAGETFLISHFCFSRRHCFPNFYCFLYIRSCCRWASIANTIPQGVVSSAQISNNAVRTDQSVTTKARIQSEREIECRRRVFTQLTFSSKRTKNSENTRQNCTSTHQAAGAGVMRAGLPSFPISKRCTTNLSPFFLCVSFMHATSGFFSWSMELLDFGMLAVGTYGQGTFCPLRLILFYIFVL